MTKSFFYTNLYHENYSVYELLSITLFIDFHEPLSSIYEQILVIKRPILLYVPN